MDQLNQTNNLQQAIDEVANKDNNQFGIPPMPPTDAAAAPFDETSDGPSAESILAGGVAADAAAPAVDAAPAADAAPALDAAANATPDIPTPEMPAVAPEAPATPEVSVAPEAPAVTPEITPTVDTPTISPEVSAPADGDLASIRESVVKDLIPVIDNVKDATPEEKFGVYEEAMKTMHDAKTIGGAYRTATQITDESKKADALMGLMRTIDNA